MSGDNSCEEEQPAGERASEPSEHVRSDSEPKRALYVVLFGLCREQTYLRQALDNSWPRVSRASGNWSMRPSIMPRNKRMIPWQTRRPSILSPVGIGLEYSFPPKIQAYANVSQAYRPPIVTRAIPTTNTAVAGDLQENFVRNYEFGFRGRTPWLTLIRASS